MYRRALSCIAFGTLLSVAGAAQTITVGNLECLPNEWNASLTAEVDPEVDGSDSVRLYFRRLNTTGAFYWTELNPTGGGAYWTVFPKPEDRDQQQLTDEWWEILQNRDWMEGRDREWLEEWLEDREHEAAEYYVAVVDAAGRTKARSKAILVEVQDSADCEVRLDPYQAGQAANLVVGETTELQEGHEVFHWLCDGLVSRVNHEGVLRADEICRACVIAAWLPVPATAGALIAGTTIEKREPRRVSDPLP